MPLLVFVQLINASLLQETCYQSRDTNRFCCDKRLSLHRAMALSAVLLPHAIGLWFLCRFKIRILSKIRIAERF